MPSFNNVKKGQFAIEYLLVTGFLFMLLIPSLYILYSYSAQSQEQVSLAQATEVGHAIIATVEKVYSYGKGSKLTLDFTMPALGEEFYYQCLGESPCELVIKIRENELSFSTDVPLFSDQAEKVMDKQYFGKKETGDRERFVAPGQKTLTAVHAGNNVVLTLS